MFSITLGDCFTLSALKQCDLNVCCKLGLKGGDPPSGSAQASVTEVCVIIKCVCVCILRRDLRFIEVVENVCQRLLGYNLHKERSGSNRFAKVSLCVSLFSCSFTKDTRFKWKRLI